MAGIDKQTQLELLKLRQDLRQLPKDVQKETRKKFRALARVVAMDAKARAPKRKGKLAKGIRARVSGRGDAAVAANAPHSRIHEFGGRHPVFGDTSWKGTPKRRVWVTQRARPYLGPAVAANREKFLEGARAAVDDAARKARFT